MSVCQIPPKSRWWCSREAGHEGPCAARRVRSQESRDKTIETFGKRADLFRRAENYRITLQTIVDVYDMRSELFTNDEDLAANLADRARLALSAGAPP